MRRRVRAAAAVDLDIERILQFDRDARLQVMDAQGVEANWLFPSQGVVIEAPMLQTDVEAAIEVCRAFNRWIEDGLTDTLEKEHVGCIVFSPLAQGLLTNKYLNGIPEDSRAAKHTSLDPDSITPAKVEKVKKLNEIAKARRQSLAQMAVAWTLRDKVVTSSLIGASKVAHVEEAVAALNNTAFSAGEIQAIEAALK